jgi:uncharacterized protein YrrD
VKAGDVIGRQITVREGGAVIGKIRDLVVDPTGREVIGIVVAEGAFSGVRVAPWKAVQAFGPDSLVLDAAGSVVKSTAIPEIQAVLDKKDRIKGLRLLTTKGKELGKIIDVLFDETSGEVVGFELSSGLFSDSFDGTPFLPTPQWMEMGKDAAFVAPEVEPTITATGGVRSALRRGVKQAVPAPPPVPVEMPAPADVQAPAPTGSETATNAPTGADAAQGVGPDAGSS